MTDESVEKAHQEMEFTVFEGSFGQNFDTSIPCQLRFEGDPTRDVSKFEKLLDEAGFSTADTNPTRGLDGVHYENELVSQEDYKQIKILVFRGEAVRIYPYENEPSVDELRSLIEAIEEAYGAELRHSPIEQEAA